VSVICLTTSSCGGESGDMSWPLDQSVAEVAEIVTRDLFLGLGPR
jgi:hypothetical protein